MQPGLRLRISSRYEEIDLVDLVTESLLSFLGFDEQTRERTCLAVREAVANAVEHGNRLDATKPVEIRYAVEDDEVVVRVSDQGTGFDPKTLPDPRSPENILKPKGRGIFLMRAFMDEVDFSFDNSTGTTVRMRQRRVAQPAVAEGKEDSQT